MKMKKQLFASIAVASTIGFFTPLTTYAFGLGEIKVMSALNEPFKASIDINALAAEEKESFEIRIASNDEFDKAGLDRSYILTQLKFDVVEQQGKSRVLISSEQPIKEPFLDFLLTASAGGGRLIREYTVLLDPPEVLMSSTAKPRSTPKANTVTSTKTESSQSNALRFSSQKYGPVAKADTLWNIALTTRPNASVSVQQMMLALVEANPEAFVDNNINGLKAGYTLTIPDQAAILSKSQAEAYQLFKTQNAQWRQRNKAPVKSAPAVVQQPQAATTEDEVVQSDAENSVKDNLQASSPAIESDADKEAHLKLVAPEQSKTTQDDASPNLAGNEKINALTEQLTLAQETMEAQAQENIDFKARMDAMEEQLETMRRLISLKDADLARLQDLLEDKDQANNSAEATDDLSDTAVVSEIEPDVSNVDEPNSSSLETEEGDAAATGTEETVSELPASDGVAPDNLVDTIKAFLVEYKLQLGGALLLVLLVLLLLARRKNSDDSSYAEVTDFDASNPADDEQFTSEIQVEEVPENNDVDKHSDDEPLSQEQLPQKSVMELVEQADMFVGYADYAQAKIALEQAKAREPANTLVAYKLLFVLYKQKQVDDFISLAETTDFDEESIEWDEIKQWGAQLAPGHALFTAEESQVTDDIQPVSVIEETIDADDVDDERLEFSRHHDADEDSIVVELSEDNDDSIDTDITEDDDAPLEFDTVEPYLSNNADDELLLSDPATASEVLLEEDDKSEENHIDDDLLSFDTGTTFGTGEQDDDEDESEIEHDSLLPFEPGASSSLDPERIDIAPFNINDNDDEPDIEFDIGDIDEIDEAETKLDLASAYIEMDDADGARSILNEVLAEGNEEQKVRAQTILDSLSE
jgi:pilus assembly protein FimV